jgi:type II secretion system protein J
VLLEQVRGLKLRFLDQGREWQEQWPPRSGDNEPLLVMPLAVELTLELDGWGAFRRLIPTAGGGVTVPESAVSEEKS